MEETRRRIRRRVIRRVRTRAAISIDVTQPPHDLKPVVAIRLFFTRPRRASGPPPHVLAVPGKAEIHDHVKMIRRSKKDFFSSF